jgi:Protein of unknown function DUF262
MERVDYEKLVVQDIINLDKNEELNLTPWYQRRSVWTKPQQAYLINTLFERKPVPTVYIRHSIDLEKEKSIKEVVDGQQRIRCILDFRLGKFAARHPSHKKRVKYEDLSPAERSKFLMTPISVGYLIAADESAVIDIFGRINSVAKTLNAQEKRNAKFSGEFKQFSLKKAVELVHFWRTRKIFSDNDISRMQEVQFVSDTALNFDLGLQDFSQAKLDNYYNQNEETYSSWNDVDKQFEYVFGSLNDLSEDLLSKSNFSREPLLFSLCIVLKDYKRLSNKKLEDIVREIDDVIALEVPITDRTRAEAAFLTAISSSTQRLASRKIRDSFIRRHFAKA